MYSGFLKSHYIKVNLRKIIKISLLNNNEPDDLMLVCGEYNQNFASRCKHSVNSKVNTTISSRKPFWAPSIRLSS